MFNKTPSARAKRPAEPPASEFQARPPSILSADMVVEGRLVGDGELHVDGVIRGDVEVVRLVVGESATVEGAIKAGAVEVRGRVFGDIEARTVRLYASSRVEGDIAQEQLSIETGAVFIGRSKPLPTAGGPANVIALEAPQPGAA